MKYKSKKEAMGVRTDACRFAAEVLSSRPELEVCPMVWSLCVFFESYIMKGANDTWRDFGPKKPAKLRVVKNA